MTPAPTESEIARQAWVDRRARNRRSSPYMWHRIPACPDLGIGEFACYKCGEIYESAFDAEMCCATESQWAAAIARKKYY